MRIGTQRNRIATVLITAFFLLVLVSTISNQHAEAVEVLPRVSVLLFETKHTVDVHPGANGTLEIDGMVIVEGEWLPGYDDIAITLFADTGGWEYDAPDEDIVLTEEHRSENFTVILYVPLQTSKATQAGINITGNWFSESNDKGGKVNAGHSEIRIKQYYQFSISSDERFGSVNGGEEWGFRCRLINEGNGHDRIRLEIVNIENLTQNGVNVTLSQDKFQAPEKQEMPFTITISTNETTTPGNYSIHVRAFSAQAEGLGEEVDVSDLELFLDIGSGGSDEEVPFPGMHVMIISIAAFTLVVFVKGRRMKRK